ncbi:MAG TPA: C25 family cysteine peptidase, partial [Thermoanaerobaculia bacterium]|nr:C25 family cysteine peptidase [Thermoanaerobaculia bacterium]
VDTKGRTRLHGPLAEEEGTCASTIAPPSPTIADLGRPRVARIATNARQPHAHDAATAKRLAATSALKISIDREGWYRVARPAGSDPRKLQLYANGIEHAIRVDGDFVEFYATGHDTPWSASRTYWLVEGNGAGRRIKTVDAPASSTTLRSYPYSVERHDRNIYASEIRNGEPDNFFGPVVSDWTATQTLALPHVDPHGEATLRIVIQGVMGEHRVAVRVNGHDAGTIAFLPTERATRTLAFPSSWLVSGDNEITLTAGGPDQLSAVESVRITYPHTYDADGDSLLFSAPGGQAVVLRGFTSARVFDTTEPANVIEIRGTSFVAPGSGTRTFLAVTAPSAPLAIAENVPSDWASRKNEGAVVILTTRTLAPSLEPLRAHRAAQYGSAVIVDVEDLYDEFASGNKTPFAIRDFVLASRQWKQPPRFFLLAGDASFDPRNYLGLGSDDAIPTKFVETAYLETSSDDWFTDLDGDGAADIPIGRLAVRTPADASSVVAKILAYESQRDTSWARRAITVTDVDPEIPFDEFAHSTAALLQPAYDVTHVRASVPSELAAGAGLVVYYGHGSTGQWSARRLLAVDDVPLLHNGTRLPFVMGMTCLNAFFHDVYSTSLGEALVHAPAGGAIAVWTSSGLTLPGDQVRMANAMARSLAAGTVAVGDAIVAAKKGIADRDVKTTWILLGDPALRLRLENRLQ